jgi:hypothetical protein
MTPANDPVTIPRPDLRCSTCGQEKICAGVDAGNAPRCAACGQDVLVRAVFTPPATVELEFADGLRTSLAIELLGMPVDRINWPTLKPVPGGIVVVGIKGDPVSIGARDLRYLVDAEFAAKIDKSVESLQLSRAELAEMARDSPPPPEWYDEPDEGFVRESWK